MNTPSELAPIKDIFLSRSMEALLKEFFMMESLEYGEDDEILEFHRKIFWNLEYFKKFLCFVQQNDFSCIDGGSENIEDTAVYLYICDCLRAMTSDKVQSLLEISKPDIKKHMEQYIPGTELTFFQSLQAAIYLKIPVNNRREILYLVWRAQGWYDVFSYESSFHRVNNKGEILRENIQNGVERREVLKTIQKFQRFQLLMDAHTIEDENDIHLATVMIQTFEKETGECWQKIWNIKEESVYRLKLNSYVFFKILDLEKEFRRLQREDTSSRKNIALVGGTDMGD